MTRRRHFFQPGEPLRHPDHSRPRTRREFIAQGFALGAGTVLGGGLLNLLGAGHAQAALSADLAAQAAGCGLTSSAGGFIPFVCFDLAGGANIAGSNVLVGQRGGQQDFLSTAGYGMLGLPGNLAPNSGAAGTFIDTSMGLAFHSLSAMLRGIRASASTAALANTNGAVIPARSENDTGNNPHNPLYAVYRAGARGSLVDLIGSVNSDSGGNSMAPAMLIDPAARPTKVDRPTDVTGLVGTSDLPRLLSQADTVAAMESMKRLGDAGVDTVGLYRGVADSAALDRAKCEILKSVANTDQFGASSPDPLQDPFIAGGSAPGGGALAPIFGAGGLAADGEFRKTASVMKLVIGQDAGFKHYAAAGSITMGGYDYHTGDRVTGELRDERAGRCIGACLEYAHRLGVPVMVYVFSDGSVSSNGRVDPMQAEGKTEWTGDNQSTAASFFLVYNPGGRPQLLGGTLDAQLRHQQLGWFRGDGSVETASSPAGNSVTQLVDMVALNYLALHGPTTLGGMGLDGRLSQALAGRAPGSILGGMGSWSNYTAFAPITA